MEFHRFFEFDSSGIQGAMALLQPYSSSNPETIDNMEGLYLFGKQIHWLSIPLDYEKLKTLDIMLLRTDIQKEERLKLFPK